MMNAAVVNDARVMAKGQVTIPKNIRAALGISPGDRVTFVAENGSARVVKSHLVPNESGGKIQASDAREQAFSVLESMRRKIPDLDYEKELAEYREEKYL